jgi:hypothetical protein
MSKTLKKKLCWNCEGAVSFEEENCPFCGVYLSPHGRDHDEEEEEENDFFTPPYPSEKEEETPLPKPPLKKTDENLTDLKKVAMPVTLLLSGTVFFLFGLALFLFSRGGLFILRWNGSYWHIYLTVGLASLFFGWKSLNKLGEEV